MANVQVDFQIDEGYNKGYVQCADCRRLESYWKNSELVFFKCKTSSVTMKILERKWRECPSFAYTDEPASERRNETK